jgi:hypothetical protein
MTKLNTIKPVKYSSGLDKVKPDLDGIFDDEPMLDNSSIWASKKDLVTEFTKLSDESDPKPQKERVTWYEFIKKLKKPFTAGSTETAIIPGIFKNRRIIEKDLVSRTLLAVELDSGFYNVETLTEKLKDLGLECFVYTSFLHSKTKGMLTAYFPFNKALTRDIEGTCSRMLDWLASKLGPHIHPECWKVTRSYTIPSCPPGAVKWFKTIHIKGKFLRTSNFKVDKVDPKVIQTGYAPAESRTEDDYNSQAEWCEILLPLGLSYSFTEKLGKEYYTGSVKQKNTILGVVYLENNTFYVQNRAKAVGPLITGRAYRPFEAYSIIHHEGDKEATKSALLSKGYGKPEDFNKKADFSRLSKRKLALELFPPIELPLEIFPTDFRQKIVSYAQGNQCSVASMATAMLTVLSAAVGKSVVMQIKDGWQTLLFIWAMVIDDTGAGKTHPMDSAMKPILRFQARGGVNIPNISGNNLDQVCEVEPRRHFYTQNISIESLIGRFRESSRGIIIHLDEITGLLEGMTQQKNNKSIDFSNLIALFDGKPLFADSKAGPIDCRESGAAIIGGIQTARYYEAFDKQLHENGMAYRFLPLPFNQEPQNFTDDSITKELEDQWSDILTWMYNIPTKIDPETGCIISEALTVEKDGKELFQAFYHDFTRSKDFMPKEFAGYLPKLITYCLKFSGLLHLLYCYPKYEEITQPVKKAIIAGAIQLAKYYAGQALKLTVGKEDVNDQYEDKIKKCLISLRGEFKNNKLLLQRVLVEINEQLPSKLTLKTKQLSNLLRNMDLVVKPSNASKSYVIWDDEIILE